MKQEIKQEVITPIWEELLKKSIVNEEQLSKISKINIKKEDIKQVIKNYPMSINPYYLSLIKNENDPIWKQCIPDVREIEDEFGFEDPLHEEENSPVYGLTHRYPDRVLLLISNRCAMYCRFSLLPGTKILMEDLSEKNIEDIKIGDGVISHKGRVQRVYDSFKRKYNKQILQIKTRRNLSINTTE